MKLVVWIIEVSSRLIDVFPYGRLLYYFLLMMPVKENMTVQIVRVNDRIESVVFFSFFYYYH